MKPKQTQSQKPLYSILEISFYFIFVITLVVFTVRLVFASKEVEVVEPPIETIEVVEVVEPPREEIKPFDIDILAIAVSGHETGFCTTGSAISHNNCFGIMIWKSGVRRLRYFQTKEDSFIAFKSLWTRKYGGMPTIEMAKKYSGSDRSEQWLENVLYFYNKSLGQKTKNSY